jgi:hypothetical protein
MRGRSGTLLRVLLVITSCCRQLGAQVPGPGEQLTLDASILAGGLSYARTTAPEKLVGVGVGVGYEFNVRLVHGEPWGRKSTEIVHVQLFELLRPLGRWQYEIGVRAAGDLHTAQVASEATFGGFLGGYVAPMWGGRHFRMGPRVQAGAYWSSPRPSFGISVTPITARLFFKL